MTGSSPLARGLRLQAVPEGLRARIIPARAGFTLPTRPSTSGNADHPRSRGVYATTTWTAVIIPGSSPLARGLHGHPGDGDGGARIIPARAGFTGRDSVTSTGTWDHPRSRGVYVAHDRNVMGTVGSSPLARGLRDYRIACVRDGRIIPARAGFTRRCVSRWPAPWDHPRSRGVYSRNEYR